MQPDTILQTVLNDMSRALLNDDFVLYESHVSLPFSLTTAAADLSVTTMDDLRNGFDAYGEMLRSQRLTDIVRRVQTARFDQNGDIQGKFITHLIFAGDQTVPPFPSTILLCNVDGKWRMSHLTNTLQNVRWPLLFPQVQAEELADG